MRRVLHPAFLLAALSPLTAAAQTYVVHRLRAGPAPGEATVHLNRAALAGQTIRIWAATLTNPDCTAAGTMTTQVLDEPRHGEVSLSDEPFFPSFTAPNPRAVCDTRKVPGRQAFYTAAPGFHGHEKVELRNSTSDWIIRKVVIDILLS